jgi:hypothetical protein
MGRIAGRNWAWSNPEGWVNFRSEPAVNKGVLVTGRRRHIQHTNAPLLGKSTSKLEESGETGFHKEEI